MRRVGNQKLWQSFVCEPAILQTPPRGVIDEYCGLGAQTVATQTDAIIRLLYTETLQTKEHTQFRFT